MDKKEYADKTKTSQSSGEAGRTVGPYRLLQKVGEGGMGEVWVAEQLLRQALELNRRILGPDHPEVSTNINNLGLLLRDKGDLDQAIALFREVTELDRKNLGEAHPYVALRMNNLAARSLSFHQG